jgi:hypothetical protein
MGGIGGWGGCTVTGTQVGSEVGSEVGTLKGKGVMEECAWHLLFPFFPFSGTVCTLLWYSFYMGTLLYSIVVVQ